MTQRETDAKQPTTSNSRSLAPRDTSRRPPQILAIAANRKTQFGTLLWIHDQLEPRYAVIMVPPAEDPHLHLMHGVAPQQFSILYLQLHEIKLLFIGVRCNEWIHAVHRPI